MRCAKKDEVRSLCKQRKARMAMIAVLPPLEQGFRYRLGRTLADNTERMIATPVKKDFGAVWICYGMEGLRLWCVNDACGVAFARFPQRKQAMALANSLRRIETYWTRATKGDTRAANAFISLVRIHQTRAYKREAR